MCLETNEFGGIFASAISGQYLGKPIGIADVTWNGCCWTVKTVKNKRPHTTSSVRLISGRNSPIYSSGISDPLSNPRLTGQSVLDIFNNRINQAKQKHDDVRLVVLVRNMEAQEFTLFERPIYPLVVNRYSWEVNERGNLCAFDGDTHAFTWQPHGSQFTIHEPIPSGAAKFRITRVPKVLELKHILNHVGFDRDWVDTM